MVKILKTANNLHLKDELIEPIKIPQICKLLGNFAAGAVTNGSCFGDTFQYSQVLNVLQ